MKLGPIPRPGELDQPVSRYIGLISSYTSRCDRLQPHLRPRICVPPCLPDPHLLLLCVSCRKLYMKLVLGLLVGTALEFYDFAGK